MKRPAFEELTLLEVLNMALYHPRATLQRFLKAIAVEPVPSQRDTQYAPPTIENADAPVETLPSTQQTEFAQSLPEVATDAEVVEDTPPVELPRTSWLVLSGILMAMVLMFLGGGQLWGIVTDPTLKDQRDLDAVYAWFVLGLLTYLFVMLLQSQNWWLDRLRQFGGGNAPPEDFEADGDVETEDDEALAEPEGVAERPQVFAVIERHYLRIALVPIGFVLAYLSYSQGVVRDAQGNVTDVLLNETVGVAWFLSIVVWYLILAVDVNALVGQLLQRLEGENRQPLLKLPRVSLLKWQYVALVVIMLLAGYFRFNNLDAVPPDMTSDHMEKLKDAVRVYEGYYPFFFENNGGREAFQMYFIAGLMRVFDLEFSFFPLKLASIIEGMLTVFLGYWLGIVILQRDEDDPEKAEMNRRMGIWLGLAFAMLLAMSSWHVMISRLALRIALTPLTTLLLLIFLVRAIRSNSRRDFAIVGLVLGAGIYFYQSNRMLPLVVIAGTLIGIMAYARRPRDFLRYSLNLATAGILAIIIFLPMFRYGQEFPEAYWDRTRGRIFGEEAFQRVNEDGELEGYEPTTQEQIDLVLQDIDVFGQNYQDALLMWSWEGDGMWINNGGLRPAFDPYTNGLFILGLLGWFVLMLRQREWSYLILPAGILIMLLPTALTLAYMDENPSFTRASGTIPFVFLIAAYPLAHLGYTAQHLFRQERFGLAISTIPIVLIIFLASGINYETYFEVYEEGYSATWKPYSEFAEPLSEFAEGEGSWGNAFLIGWTHWLDHRIVGTVAGDIRWDNGLVNREDVYAFLGARQGTPYEYDPNKPLFFMYNMEDELTRVWLAETFPNGVEAVETVVGRPELSFYTYITPVYGGTLQDLPGWPFD